LNPARVALVGCGGVVRRYRRAYAGIPEAQVVRTIDVQGAEAEMAATELGAKRSSTQFEEALSPEIDAVVISTPNHLHCEQAVAALRAGKHVLLQKPMAPTVAECDRILEAHRQSGKVLGIYMNLLEHPLVHDLKKMIALGLFGKVVLYSARLAHRGGLSWKGAGENWRGSKVKTGGGSFIQLAVHYQHLMQWLTGASITRAQAISRNVACPQLEGDDLTLAQYELSSGALGDIQTSWCTHEEHLSVMGTEASFHYRDNMRLEYVGHTGPFRGEILDLKGDGSSEMVDRILPAEWDDAGNPYNQHRQFFEALAQGRQPAVSGEDGREDVRWVEVCYGLNKL
jgi:predicted dehydrogenase